MRVRELGNSELEETLMNNKHHELLLEAKRLTALVNENLTEAVDPSSLSMLSKVPYKVMVIRESLLYRASELASTSCCQYEEGNLASAVILTRALAETVAVLNYLNLEAKEVISTKNITGFDKTLMKILMGSRKYEDLPQAINIITVYKKLDKLEEFSGAYDSYKCLCEYAHPNWCGTFGLYGKTDHKRIITHFSKNARGEDVAYITGLNSMVGSLCLLFYAYNQFDDFLKDLVQVCEAVVISSNRSVGEP